jgi:hypothetical protein
MINQVMKMKKAEIYHDKSAHRSSWVWALSAAASKIGNDRIRALRIREGATRNSEGLRHFTLQDAHKYTGDMASVMLTGKLLNASETQLVDGSDVSKKDKNRAVFQLWTSINWDCRRKGDCRYGVFSVRGMAGLHALLWSDQDVDNNCASLVDPRCSSEIEKEFAEGRWRYRTRELRLCEFQFVTRALFLSTT